jgi:hypothetical protein
LKGHGPGDYSLDKTSYFFKLRINSYWEKSAALKKKCVMANNLFKPTFLKGLILGVVLALFLMAILPVSFQPSAAGQGVGGRVAVSSGTYQISVRGFVPVICRVSLDQQSALAGGKVTDLGVMHEFCNNANGYIVYVDSSPGLSGGIISVDGRKIALAASGSTAIAQSDRAARKSRKISLDLSQLPNQNGSLWFRIVPL